MAAAQWEVVGGGDKGGITVRAGKELSSPQLPDKLSTGALLEELGRAGDRLNYRLLSGTGPEEGWVSIRLKDKILLELRSGVSAGDSLPSTAGPAAGGQPPAPAAPPEQVPKAKAEPADDYASRLAALREKYPGVTSLEIPDEAKRWPPKDLENFVASGGFITPQGYSKRSTPAAAKPAEKKKPGSEQNVPQFSVVEALNLMDQLRHGFVDKDFQQRLLKLQNQFPNRKQRGHADGPQFFEAFEGLAMTVYFKVLPKHKLTPDWDGVRDMYAKLVTALMHPKVKKQHEEMNTLLGLPRDAQLKPSKKSEEVFVYRPAMDADVPGLPLPTVEDDDGDEAHEFFVEDRSTGDLHSLVESTSCWFKIVHRPHVTVRSKPDAKSNPVGTKLCGARVRVQRVVDSKWLLLHEAEAKKLNTQEAWVLSDGREMGLGEMAQRIVA